MSQTLERDIDSDKTHSRQSSTSPTSGLQETYIRNSTRTNSQVCDNHVLNKVGQRQSCEVVISLSEREEETHAKSCGFDVGNKLQKGYNNTLRTTRMSQVHSATDPCIETHCTPLLQPSGPIRSQTVTHLKECALALQRPTETDRQVAIENRDHRACSCTTRKCCHSVNSVSEPSTPRYISLITNHHDRQTAPHAHCPHETVVLVDQADSDFMSAEFEVNSKPRKRNTPSDDSGYEHCVLSTRRKRHLSQPKTDDTRSHGHYWIKRFLALCLLNVVFILVIASGLVIFIYSMRQQQTPNSVALQQSADRLLETSQQCIDCSTPKMDDINGPDMAENIRSYEQLNTKMKELKQEIDSVRKLVKASEFGKTMIHLDAAGLVDDTIKWTALYNPIKMALDSNGMKIEVPRSGYYYIYGRVVYKTNITLADELVKTEVKIEDKHGSHQTIDNVQQNIKTGHSADALQICYIGLVRSLKEGDKLFVTINAQYFDPKSTVFGMFFLSNL